MCQISAAGKSANIFISKAGLTTKVEAAVEKSVRPPRTAMARPIQFQTIVPRKN